ncbi:hypothetical protein [Nonomuraea lactucae]|uniref:hypothetical protein n=1 Tax=Nonomuraea lactucae TaxID=2249762 RepID=UPI000DE3D0EE|nr:hypothetical protein [Nonomuraea lactucae]
MTRVWYERDLRVLQAIVQLKDENPGQPIPREDVAETTGMDEETVRRAIYSLMDEPYLETGGSLIDNHEYVKRVLGNGKRAAEFWPTPDNVAELLRDALLQAAEREPDEEKRGKLRALGAWLAEGGRDTVSGAFGSMLGTLLGG